LLGWVRVPLSVPQRLRSYAALRPPCRFDTPPVCPRSCLTSQGPGSADSGRRVRWLLRRFPARASVRLPWLAPSCSQGGARCRRVRWPFRPFPGGPQSGSLSPRFHLPLTARTYRGLPGYRAILFGRAAVEHPAGPPSARPNASRGAAFQVFDPLSIRDYRSFRGCIPAAHPLACLRFNRPLTANGCKTGYQPAGYALAGWGSHPLDDSSRFWSTS
jgi:hypothetical protein